MVEGLTTAQAHALLQKFGPNKIPEKKEKSAFSLFISQFKNIFSLMLIAAVALSFLVGDRLDGFLILIILILNAFLSFWQEFKATREIQALANFEPPHSRAVRDGKEFEILSADLVPGDVVVIGAGDKIPADGKLIEGFEVKVNESSLTGESTPVAKSVNGKNNELFLGTWVVEGEGKIEITATGENTKFGKIAGSLEEIQEELTPLEISLNSLAIKISIIIFGIAGFISVLSLIQGTDLVDVFFGSIALIIAAVPEGLPAIITVLLAIGARRMYKKKTLVRRMSAIENLGITDVILIDKTGTITKNEMAVRTVDIKNEDNKGKLIQTAVVCNSASLVKKENDPDSFDILGDTMEGALLIWAKKQNADIDSLREEFKVIREIPFDSKRKMMSVLASAGDETFLFSKGAPEVIIPLLDTSKNYKNSLKNDYKKMAEDGLRVLALAFRDYTGKSTSANLERKLKFLGLVGIADEPREEAKEAIRRARAAGIEIVMITGDNELTAKEISEDVGLLTKDDEVITADLLDEMDEAQLKKRIFKIRIYARANPEHKLRIVEAFQSLGYVVAVTGDGVNDSLALKRAQVGVSMGIAGTDVAKESSDLIILDDNLSTIITAIEQGRLIFRNILKIIRFLLTGNLSEVLLILIVTLLGFPIPLLPAQILWINFVTDGLPAISLAADKSPGNLLTTPKRSTNSLFDLKMFRFIGAWGGLIATLNVIAFIYSYNVYGIDFARNTVFTLMIVSQMMFLMFVIRKRQNFLGNKYLLFSVALVLIFQLLILTVPPLQNLFGVYGV